MTNFIESMNGSNITVNQTQARSGGVMEAIVPPMEVVVHDTEIVEVMVAGRDQMMESMDMVVVATPMAIMMSMVVEMVAMVATITMVVMVGVIIGIQAVARIRALALQSCIFKLYYKSFSFC